MTILNWAALLVIVGTLIGVAIGRYPWLRMNRATIALTGVNIGSTATVIGNPQNMRIGLASRIPFVTFITYRASVALAGLGVAWLGVIWLSWVH